MIMKFKVKPGSFWITVYFTRIYNFDKIKTSFSQVQDLFKTNQKYTG